jgi:hypothetical protein
MDEAFFEYKNVQSVFQQCLQFDYFKKTVFLFDISVEEVFIILTEAKSSLRSIELNSKLKLDGGFNNEQVDVFEGGQLQGGALSNLDYILEIFGTTTNLIGTNAQKGNHKRAQRRVWFWVALAAVSFGVLAYAFILQITLTPIQKLANEIYMNLPEINGVKQMIWSQSLEGLRKDLLPYYNTININDRDLNEIKNYIVDGRKSWAALIFDVQYWGQVLQNLFTASITISIAGIIFLTAAWKKIQDACGIRREHQHQLGGGKIQNEYSPKLNEKFFRFVYKDSGLKFHKSDLDNTGLIEGGNFVRRYSCGLLAWPLTLGFIVLCMFLVNYVNNTSLTYNGKTISIESIMNKFQLFLATKIGGTLGQSLANRGIIGLFKELLSQTNLISIALFTDKKTDFVSLSTPLNAQLVVLWTAILASGTNLLLNGPKYIQDSFFELKEWIQEMIPYCSGTVSKKVVFDDQIKEALLTILSNKKFNESVDSKVEKNLETRGKSKSRSPRSKSRSRATSKTPTNRVKIKSTEILRLREPKKAIDLPQPIEPPLKATVFAVPLPRNSPLLESRPNKLSSTNPPSPPPPGFQGIFPPRPPPRPQQKVV